MKYVLMPFVAWFAAGCLKFCINYLRHGSKAKEMIGYGGFPSTHTAVVSSTLFLIGLSEGFCTPIFSMGLALFLIVVIDAHGLRRKVGEQARIINQLSDETHVAAFKLRERMGHSWLEIVGGIIWGLILALLMGSF